MVKTYNKKTDSNKKLSKNFALGEFSCKCGKCSKTLVDSKLVTILQKIRDRFGKSVIINSGYRCAAHNKAVGGATSSRHLKGTAADIAVIGVSPKEVAKYAESIGVKGIGMYDSSTDGRFVHIDTRTSKSFWKGKAETPVNTFGGSAKKIALQVPMLEEGHEFGAVFAMQALLIGHKYDVEANGVFDTATKTALKKYQREYDLEADGVCGPATWASLLGLD